MCTPYQTTSFTMPLQRLFVSCSCCGDSSKNRITRFLLPTRTYGRERAVLHLQVFLSSSFYLEGLYCEESRSIHVLVNTVEAFTPLSSRDFSKELRFRKLLEFDFHWSANRFLLLIQIRQFTGSRDYFAKTNYAVCPPLTIVAGCKTFESTKCLLKRTNRYLLGTFTQIWNIHLYSSTTFATVGIGRQLAKKLGSFWLSFFLYAHIQVWL